MKRSNLAAMLLAVAMLWMACQKNNNLQADEQARSNNDLRTESLRTDASIVTAKDFVEQRGPQLQSFSVNAANGGTIELRAGTKISIPRNAFTKDGKVVSGIVNVVAREYSKRSDVLIGGSNTVTTNGAPLETQGSFFLDAQQNGVSLDRTLAAPIRLAVPAPPNANVTQLWDAKPAQAAPAMAWAPVQGREVVSQGNAFIFDFGQLGWINCDVFYANPNPKTTVRVTVLNNPGAFATFRGFTGETFVFFCPDNANVAAQLYTPDGVDRVKSYDNMMPIGVTGTLISFAIKNGGFWLATKSITITAGLNETLTLAPSTEAAVQAAITALN